MWPIWEKHLSVNSSGSDKVMSEKVSHEASNNGTDVTKLDLPLMSHEWNELTLKSASLWSLENFSTPLLYVLPVFSRFPPSTQKHARRWTLDAKSPRVWMCVFMVPSDRLVIYPGCAQWVLFPAFSNSLKSLMIPQMNKRVDLDITQNHIFSGNTLHMCIIGSER